jgi:hypothetical protein
MAMFRNPKFGLGGATLHAAMLATREAGGGVHNADP